ncbi:MFS transporter, partial [Candidatus Bathyarchaeota archaeon]|nr:MFS transporter [Candidatus Bathyarchaeota archaeon]
TIANAVTPPAGAFLIERMGGLSQMRIIYLIQFVATLIVWVYTMKLKDTEALKTEKGKMLPEILLEIKDTINVLKENRALWWIWIFTIGSFAYGASSPYWILFAAEAYSSPYVVIGLLSTVYSVTNALTLIPVGRFSDRKGRIRAIKYLRPISYLSLAIFLIGYRFKLSFMYLIPLIVWGLRGIGGACSAPCRSAVNEVVPQEFLGRWRALRTFLVSIAGVPSGILGSLLWSIDPFLPFLFTLLIEIAIRYPIVYFKLPETLYVNKPAW